MLPHGLDLDLLRSYVVVCRTGSLSRAADPLARTQSALSMQMRRLEGLLGRTLLRRTGRGVSPTADGELLLGYATRMLALGEEAVARLREPVLGGTVRIAMPDEIVLSLLPGVLARLRADHPDLTLEVSERSSSDAVALWLQGDMDLMVGVPSVVPREALSTWNVGLEWVTGPGHVASAEGPLDVAVFAEPCIWRHRVLETLTAAGRPWRIAFTGSGVASVQAAVAGDIGVTLLPRECIRRPLVRVPPGLGLPGGLFAQYGVYARDRRTDGASAVLEALLAGLPSVPEAGPESRGRGSGMACPRTRPPRASSGPAAP